MTNRTDNLNYSRYYVKRLMAEQLVDAVSQVTGVAEEYRDHVPGTRAMTIAAGAPSYFLETFGRLKERDKIAERETQTNIAQTMHLISGDTIHDKVTAAGGTLDRWLADACWERRITMVCLSKTIRSRSPISSPQSTKSLASITTRNT